MVKRKVYKSRNGKIFNTPEEAARENRRNMSDVEYRYYIKSKNTQHPKEYTIPFEHDKKKVLTNAGLATGAIISENLLDTIAKHAYTAGLPIRPAIGLGVKESTLGNPTDDGTFYLLFKPGPLREDFKALHDLYGTEQHINYNEEDLYPREVFNWHMVDSKDPYQQAIDYATSKSMISEEGDIDREKFLRMLELGEKYADSKVQEYEDTYGKNNVVENAFRFYKNNPDKYNPGLSNYQLLVDKRSNEVMNSPEILEWYNNMMMRNIRKPDPITIETPWDDYKKANGGSLEWKDLSMRDRAAYIRLGVANGLKNIDSIRAAYNKFDKGGNKRETISKEKQTFLLALDMSLSNPRYSKYNTPQWRNFLTELAYTESGYRPNITNSIGAKGYFLLMPSNRSSNWETPTQQFHETYNLFDSNLAYLNKNMTKKDWETAKKNGIDIYGLMGGAHLGGPGNVIKALRGKGNAKDKNGTSVLSYMRKFSLGLSNTSDDKYYDKDYIRSIYELPVLSDYRNLYAYSNYSDDSEDDSTRPVTNLLFLQNDGNYINEDILKIALDGILNPNYIAFNNLILSEDANPNVYSSVYNMQDIPNSSILKLVMPAVTATDILELQQLDLDTLLLKELEDSILRNYSLGNYNPMQLLRDLALVNNEYADGGLLDNNENEGSGIFGNETVDNITSYLPIIGTILDAYTLYKNPSWEYDGDTEPTQQMQQGYIRQRPEGTYFYDVEGQPEIDVTPLNTSLSSNPADWTFTDAAGKIYNPHRDAVQGTGELSEGNQEGPILSAVNNYLRELNWRAKNDPSSILLQGKYTMPAIAASALLPIAGEAAAATNVAGVPLMTWADAGLTAGFGAHGLNHWLNEGINGWGDAAMTALEVAPLGRLAKPIWNTGKKAVYNIADRYMFMPHQNSFTRGIGITDAGLQDAVNTGVFRGNPRGTEYTAKQFTKGDKWNRDHFKDIMNETGIDDIASKFQSRTLSEEEFNAIKEASKKYVTSRMELVQDNSGKLGFRTIEIPADPLEPYPNYASYKDDIAKTVAEVEKMPYRVQSGEIKINNELTPTVNGLPHGKPIEERFGPNSDYVADGHPMSYWYPDGRNPVTQGHAYAKSNYGVRVNNPEDYQPFMHELHLHPSFFRSPKFSDPNVEIFGKGPLGLTVKLDKETLQPVWKRDLSNMFRRGETIKTPQITAENAASMTPAQWTTAQDAAIARGDMAEAQRLRDLHFQTHTPQNRIVDAEGNPVKMIHGSQSKFTEFRHKDNPYGTHGRGMYFGIAPKSGITSYGGDNGYTYLTYLNGKSIYPDYGIVMRDKNGKAIPTNLMYEIIGTNSYDEFINSVTKQFKDRFIKNNLTYNLDNIEKSIDKKLYQKLHDSFDTKMGGIPDIHKKKHWFRKDEKYATFSPQRAGEVVVRSPNQIKLADAVTYDDNGVRIPLGKRDNFSINDIRYGLLPLGIGLTGYGILGRDR